MTRATLLLLALTTAAFAQDTAPPPAAEPAPAAEPPGVCEQAKLDADAGNAEGMLQLADCYMGAVAGHPKDPVTALAWYESAADKGVPRARRAFATTSLLTNLANSERVKAKARLILEELIRANPNDAHALFILGVDQYARGVYDVSISSLKQASELGSLQAIAMLGCLSRSCQAPPCRSSIKAEPYYEERFARIAAKLGSTASYKTMATQLRKQLLVGEACAAVAGG